MNRETAVLFGGARALLLHAAHPLVLAGARQTGFYERNPWKRLERTLHLTYAITFGSREEAFEAAERINRAHEAVRGVDPVTGLPYDARDPELLLWVHACLVDSQLLFEELAVGRLDEAGRQRFHEEQMVAAELLGLDRSRIPPTVQALRRYLRSVVESGALRVTDDTMKVANLIRRPPPEVPWRPVLRLVSWWAFGTLPEPLRSQYGVRWSPARERALRASFRAFRVARPFLPARYREIMPARLAERRMREPWHRRHAVA
ncbi:MAG TPA: oxygenase MpaB family protein [Actinomycetota bacterium]|nr:oxygenase MpaB family protein [Actinomycetota bacterium]